MSSALSFVIPQPDDFHLHVRDGGMLRAVLPATTRHFARALIMPNLNPPVVSVAKAKTYREEILKATPAGQGDFIPLMSLYLTEETSPKDIQEAVNSGWILAVKLYPAGATTNSQSGVHNLSRLTPVFQTMESLGLPLCMHGEVTDSSVDIFDREKVFIDKVLSPLKKDFPALKTVLEHVTTKEGVDFVRSAGETTAGTLTVHHLIINRNHILAGGIKPHYYCLPVAKREQHRLALLEAATSGESCFFLGTDSAPHADKDKESPCGCAGCFTALNALPCLAEVFFQNNSLSSLEAFVSRNGAAFYGLSINQKKLRLTRDETAPPPPEALTLEDGRQVTIFNPGFRTPWLVEPLNGKGDNHESVWQ